MKTDTGMLDDLRLSMKSHEKALLEEMKNARENPTLYPTVQCRLGWMDKCREEIRQLEKRIVDEEESKP